MAIPADRVLVDTITSLTQVAFDNKSDTTATKTSSASIAGSTANTTTQPGTLGSNGTKSVFSQADKPVIPQSDVAIGNVDPYSNANIDLPKAYKKSASSLVMDRSLLNYTNTPFSSNLSATDKLLTGNKRIVQISKTIYPSDESKIDKLVDTVGKTQLGNEFKKYMNQDMFKAKIKSGLSRTNSPIGDTLRSKTNLTKFISPCKGVNFDSNIDLTGLFNKNFLSSLLEGILCQGVDSVVLFVQNVIKIDAVNAPGILNAMTDTLNKDNDTSVVQKLMAMKVIKDNVPDSTASVYTRGITDKVLKNIDSSGSETNSSVSQYLNTTTALDSFDPNWDKDYQGNIDVSKIVGNRTMGNMAGNYLASQPGTNVYDGTVNNTIGRNESIAIVNSFV